MTLTKVAFTFWKSLISLPGVAIAHKSLSHEIVYFIAHIFNVELQLVNKHQNLAVQSLVVCN